ncbi:MAG: gene transfer agent family protein [Pseudomonadota bacterium]
MTRAANPARGEVEFAIDGSAYVLRPSFENLVAAEAELGSLFALVERASDGALTLSEMTALIWHCLPGEARPERDAVGRAVLSIGLLQATAPVRLILAQVLQGET